MHLPRHQPSHTQGPVPHNFGGKRGRRPSATRPFRDRRGGLLGVGSQMPSPTVDVRQHRDHKKTITHSTTVTSIHDPIGGESGTALRNGITAKSIAVYHVVMGGSNFAGCAATNATTAVMPMVRGRSTATRFSFALTRNLPGPWRRVRLSTVPAWEPTAPGSPARREPRASNAATSRRCRAASKPPGRRAPTRRG